MTYITPGNGWKASQLGHYPTHWYSHLMHALQVIGYKHPEEGYRLRCLDYYKKMVHGLHLIPEDEHTMDIRLTEDRFISGTVVS